MGHVKAAMRPLAVVRFRCRRTGSSGAWTSTSWSGRVLHQSESLVLQALRHARPGHDIELVELRWRE